MIPPPEGPEVPAFARCSVGIGRWFWVAWDTWSAARGGEPARACGYEATAHAAEKMAIESVGPRARPLPPRWAARSIPAGKQSAPESGSRRTARSTRRRPVRTGRTRSSQRQSITLSGGVSACVLPTLRASGRDVGPPHQRVMISSREIRPLGLPEFPTIPSTNSAIPR
jgi:hypothetical protein